MLLIFLFQLNLILAYSLSNVDLATPSNDQFASFYGPSVDYRFGFSVKNAGDFNGDGNNDFIISAPPEASLNANSGAVYLIFGNIDGVPEIDFSVGPSSSEGFKIQGESASDEFGISVSSAGDFNGDGLDDIMIGARSAGGKGAVYFIFGSTESMSDIILPGLNGKGFKISGDQSLAQFGHIISDLGDVNGDDIGDVIIGAPKESDASASPLTSQGAAYIFFGRKTGLSDMSATNAMSNNLGFKVVGSGSSSAAGRSVGRAGDINQDGLNDIIVGAPGMSPNLRPLAGAAYIIFGRESTFSSKINLENDLGPSDGFKIYGGAGQDGLGTSCSSAGDINGDGIDDLIVGANTVDSPGRADCGAAYIIFGHTSGFSTIDLATSLSSTDGFTVYGATAFDALGTAVDGVGDINEDGIDDFAISAPNLEVSAKTSAGGVYIIYGREGISNINLADGLQSDQGFIIQGPDANAKLGTSISKLDDVNGDGGYDIIVGAYQYSDSNGDMIGSAFVVFGEPLSGHTLLKGIVKAQAVAEVVNTAVAMLISLLRYDSGSYLLFSFLVELLYYTRYLEIDYPRRLKYMLKQPVPDIISIDGLSSAPSMLEMMITEQSVPKKFEFYNIKSSFVINFWPSIAMLLIILVGILLAALLVRFTKSKKWINDQFLKVKQSLKWNYVTIMFTGYFCNIALYTSLEVKNFAFGISMIVCIIINLVVIFLLVKMFRMLKKLRNARREVTPENEGNQEQITALKNEFKNFEIVFENYKDNLFAESYLFILCIRFYLFYLIIANLLNYPIAQTSLICVMGLAAIVYLAIKKPFKHKKDLVMSFTQELILQIVNISAFALAITDDGSNDDADVRVLFGDVIIGCNLAFIIVSLIYTVFIFIMFMRDIIRLVKAKFAKKQAIIAPEKGSKITDKQNSMASMADSQRNLINEDQVHRGISFGSPDDFSILHDNNVKPNTKLNGSLESPDQSFYSANRAKTIQKVDAADLQRTSTNQTNDFYSNRQVKPNNKVDAADLQRTSPDQSNFYSASPAKSNNKLDASIQSPDQTSNYFSAGRAKSNHKVDAADLQRVSPDQTSNFFSASQANSNNKYDSGIARASPDQTSNFFTTSTIMNTSQLGLSDAHRSVHLKEAAIRRQHMHHDKSTRRIRIITKQIDDSRSMTTSTMNNMK